MTFKRFVFSCLLITSFSFLRSTTAFGQVYSVHTNALGWCTTNMNMDFGMKLSHQLTLHLPIQYNPFSLGEARLRNLTSTPGLRYWFREAYGRSYFLGIQGIATMYNIGGVFGGKYRYQGAGFGGGLSFGYSRPFSPHWNFEMEGGLGVMWTHYGKYICKTCGAKVGSYQGARFVPTKLAVNLVYLF